MDWELISLVAACAAFVGTHFLLSNPLRKSMVRTLGERGFLMVYSLVAFATLAWIALAFHRASPAPALWDGTAIVPWIAASILTIAAMALFLAALNGNPALPMARLAGLSARKPWGVFRVTRHPMMMAFALWSVSHILIAPTARTIVLALAILLLALVGAKLQDARKLAQSGREWGVWMQRTNFWPDLGKLGDIGAIWIVAVLVWLGVTALHLWLANVPAGVWRWLI